MKRSQDKIKDFVEPQAYDDVRDFATDPARVLAAYRFTDATSDLLASWLDALAALPNGGGAAHALAGMRGVGKSHTLATFGAIASSSALRRQITDAHVMASATRLAERRFVVARVQRGTHPTLPEELIEAFSAVFGAGIVAKWGQTPALLLKSAAAHADQVDHATLLVLIDTAYGRTARVGRDDGPLLSLLAIAAHAAHAFIGLALDDDIAGAEGVNAALTQTFGIDYLAPEHLFDVVNVHLLRKHAPARGRLHDIYLTLRQTVPEFNWSEPRFAALYPIHPLVADVATFVRLHAPNFAFLPFAAQSAARAVNRPALSLILLDEVFDANEADLRIAPELQRAFALFDELATRGVAQFPALQRLQVKLILKSLFVMSLDGRGATARELCAALLFADDAPDTTIARVAEVLACLAEASGASDLAQHEGDDQPPRYCFPVGVAESFDEALAKTAAALAPDADAPNRLLRLLAQLRYTDWPLPDDQQKAFDSGEYHLSRQLTPATATPAPTLVDCYVTWRGGARLGRFIRWPLAAAVVSNLGGQAPPLPPAGVEYEWQAILLEPGVPAEATERIAAAVAAAAQGRRAARAVLLWRPAELTADELACLCRLAALRASAALQNSGDEARLAAASLMAEARLVWTRIYVEDGVIIIDGHRFRFTAEARAAATLNATLAQVLAPLLAERYPQHPPLAAALGEHHAARLCEEFFSGTNAADPEVQRLAAQFAAPLGLAHRRGTAYVPDNTDAARAQPWAREVFALVDAAGTDETVPLAHVARALRRTPYGLLREAQMLVLAALVALRRVELVTMTGERITRRELSGGLRWHELAGVCRAAEVAHNADELTGWVRLLVVRPELPSLGHADGHETVLAALADWLAWWRADAVLKDFEELPDAGLTTRAWNMASAARRTYSAVAEAIKGALEGDVTLEEGLQRVADAFGGTPDACARSREQFAALSELTNGLARREWARAYLCGAEPTGVEQIESARRELLLMTEDPHSLFDEMLRDRFDLLWREFHARYVAHYVAQHERAVGARRPPRALEDITGGDEWREFTALAQLPFVNRRLWDEAETLLMRQTRADCALPVGVLLAEQPRCPCAFRLARADEYAEAEPRLRELAARGRDAYRRTLAHFQPHLAHALTLLAREADDPDDARRAHALAETFARADHASARLTSADVRLLMQALEHTPAPQPLRIATPRDAGGLLTHAELAGRWQQWLAELPQAQTLLEVAD